MGPDHHLPDGLPARRSAALHAPTRSRPLYAPLSPDPTGLAHLVVTDGRAVPAELAERFVDVPTQFRPEPGALNRLGEWLTDARTGLRLYAYGTESFIWDVGRLAEAAGLGEDEWFAQPAADVGRRVRCLHCRKMIADVTTAEIDCPGCGLRLLVREHFSRRLAAFQGVARHGVTRGEAR